MNPVRRNLIATAIVIGTLVAAPARAQDACPTKPIRLILGFSAGGISDVLIR